MYASTGLKAKDAWALGTRLLIIPELRVLRVPFGQPRAGQKTQALGRRLQSGSYFLNIHIELVSFSQPNRFVRLDSEQRTLERTLEISLQTRRISLADREACYTSAERDHEREERVGRKKMAFRSPPSNIASNGGR